MASSIFIFLLLFVPTLSQAGMVMATRCAPATVDLDAGPESGRITQIDSLEFEIGEAMPQWSIRMAVSGLDPSLKPIQSIERYRVKEYKSGNLVELRGEGENLFRFDGIFLEFGVLDVDTAGPVPQGTFSLSVSMAFIDSNLLYKNTHPMTVVKVLLNCQQTVSF